MVDCLRLDTYRPAWDSGCRESYGEDGPPADSGAPCAAGLSQSPRLFRGSLRVRHETKQASSSSFCSVFFQL